jgi:rSAM/selenodomain-associated transferase 1
MTRASQLIVMAKAPQAGQAKTRLIPALGAEGAAQLAARLLEHAMAQARAARFDALVLACAPDATHPAFAAQARRGGVTLVAQGEGDLGARMQRCFERAFVQGFDRVVLIGTDVPSLGAGLLRAADAALAAHDAVFVPAADGGYALIGLAGPAPTLFDALPWSTDVVMATTRERLAAARLRHVELPTVHDIDAPADLIHLPAGWP